MVEALRNLGPTSAAWLAEVGIHTLEDLRAVGSVAAYRAVRAHRGETSLNLLWALEGALLDLDWRELPPGLKAELRRAVQELG